MPLFIMSSSIYVYNNGRWRHTHLKKVGSNDLLLRSIALLSFPGFALLSFQASHCCSYSRLLRSVSFFQSKTSLLFSIETSLLFQSMFFGKSKLESFISCCRGSNLRPSSSTILFKKHDELDRLTTAVDLLLLNFNSRV